MNKKIVLSLATIATAGAIAIGGTIAQFSDTETAQGTFTAGTIDIEVDDTNPWSKSYPLGDMKPGESRTLEFKIDNVGANPVNLSKNIKFTSNGGSETFDCTGLDPIGSGKTSAEPECVAEKATTGSKRADNVESQIKYDLNVEVYDQGNTKKWSQTIVEGKTLTEVYGANGENTVKLGMVPVNGYMKVFQTYNFDKNAGNEYQGDQLTLNFTLTGDQLPGEDGMASVILEDKDYDGGNWIIKSGDAYVGTLSYKTQGPLFDFTFDGTAPLTAHNYVLAVGYNSNTDVSIAIANGTTGSDGTIHLAGTFDTNTLANAKAWLVPAENWTGGAMDWSTWPTCVPNFLWETGLINYTKN